MRVDVVHFVRCHAAGGERHAHGVDGAAAFRMGRGQVVGVAGGAVAGQLGVDARAALPGVLQLFHHQHAGTLADHEAVAAAVERPAGLLGGVVVARADRLQGAEAGHRQRGDRRLGAAAQDHVGGAVLDPAVCLADGVVGGGAGGHHGIGGAARVDADGDVAGCDVADHLRHQQRVHSPGTALEQVREFRLQGVQPAETDAQQDPGAVRVERLGGQAGVIEGLHRRHDGVAREDVHAPRLARLQDAAIAEIGNLARYPGAELAGVEPGDRTDARLARLGALPERSRVGPQRIDGSETGNHHAPAHRPLLNATALRSPARRPPGLPGR